jgi:transposase-like protein
MASAALLHPRRPRRCSQTAAMRRRRTRPAPLPRSAFAGFRFPPDVIVLAVRWYLRFGLSYRDVQELLAERGVEVDGAVAPAVTKQTGAMRTHRPCRASVPRSAFAGFCFPPEVIVLAVRWYLRFALSYRDVEELLAERGIDVDHTTTIYRWVQRFTPLMAEAARPCRHAVGDRWQVDETYVKVAGRWRYVYRAIDQFGQVVDVFVSPRRDLRAARRFFERAIGTTRTMPSEVVTDRAPTYPVVLEELLAAAWHDTERYANNRVECDHGRLKARLRPMRGLKQDRSARIVIAGHAFLQNIRRGHYELAVEAPVMRRMAVTFDELALAI